MSDLEDMFKAHLERVSGNKPVVWGVDDCTAWTKTWAETITGTQLWGPDYTNREEAYTIISEYGSLFDLWVHSLTMSGYHTEQFGSPDLGCVGIVKTTRYGQIGVPFVRGGLAAWRAQTGGVGWIRPRESAIVAWWRLVG